MSSRRNGPRVWWPTGARARNWGLVIACLALICVSGCVDWFTGPEIAFSVIYLLPIGLAAWKGGRRLGLATAAGSGAVWLFIELATQLPASHPLIPYWNGIVRLMFFCLVAVLISEVVERKRVESVLRKTRDELEERVLDRTAQLESLNRTLEQRIAERSAAAEERARKLAESEAALEHQRGILQSILDSMGEGVVVTDDTGGLLLINPAAEQMLGISAGDTRAASWAEFRERYLREHATPPSGAGEASRTAIVGGGMDGTEILMDRVVASDGLWLRVSRRPWQTAGGEMRGSVIVLGNITSHKKLERQIAEVSDREQRRLGQDLHDGLCQQLVSLAFAASTLSDKLKKRSVSEAADAAKISRLLNESISQAKDIARGLYLVHMEVGGLSSALEELAEQVCSHHGLRCSFVDRTVVPVAASFASADLFRIAQEAVSNAVKHARAKQIKVTLEVDEDQVILRIEDDGVGLPPNWAEGRGMGLHMMRYRARMIGARCSIEAHPRKGTVVVCTLKNRLPSPEAADARRD